MENNSYRRSQNILSINTQVGNVAGYQPRSGVADAATALQDLVKTAANTVNTKNNKEAQELSMQTQLWNAEAQDLEKEVREREIAAEKARQSRIRDEQRRYLIAKQSADLQLENDLRLAGDDPNKLIEASNTYTTSLGGMYEGMSADAQDKVFSQHLTADTRARSTIAQGLHGIAVNEFNEDVSTYALDIKDMDEAAESSHYNSMMEQGAELGLSRADISTALMEAESNFSLVNIDTEAMVNNLNYNIIAEEKAKVEKSLNRDPALAGKDITVERLGRLDTMENAVKSEHDARITQAINNHDYNGFKSLVDHGRAHGVISEDEEKTLWLSYGTKFNEYLNKPENKALRVDAATGGEFVPAEAFPNDLDAQTAATKLVKANIGEALNGPDGVQYQTLQYHRNNNPTEFKAIMGDEINRTINRLTSLIANEPKPNSPEYQQYQQTRVEYVQRLALLEQVGAESLTKDQREKMHIVSSLLSDGRDTDIPQALKSISEQGGVGPTPLDSKASKWVGENLPEDDHWDARMDYSLYTKHLGFDDEKAKELLEAKYNTTSFYSVLTPMKNKYRQAEWSPKATEHLSGLGIGPEAMAYAEQTIVDRNNGLFDKETYDTIDVIRGGEDFRIVLESGQLQLKSSTSSLRLPLSPQQSQLLAAKINETHDLDNVDKRTKYVAPTTSQEITTFTSSKLEELKQASGGLSGAEVGERAEVLQSITDRQIEAGEAMAAATANGVPEETVRNKYTADTVTNAMAMLRSDLGDSLTPQQYRELEKKLVAEGMDHVANNGRILFGLLENPFGHPTDGLFTHLYNKGRELTGSDPLKEPEKPKGKPNRGRNPNGKSSARTPIEQPNPNTVPQGSVSSPKGSVSSSQGSVSEAEGSVSSPKGSVGSSQGSSAEIEVARNNLKAAQVEVSQAQNALDSAGSGHNKRNAQKALREAKKELAIREKALNKLTQ